MNPSFKQFVFTTDISFDVNFDSNGKYHFFNFSCEARDLRLGENFTFKCYNIENKPGTMHEKCVVLNMTYINKHKIPEIVVLPYYTTCIISRNNLDNYIKESSEEKDYVVRHYKLYNVTFTTCVSKHYYDDPIKIPINPIIMDILKIIPKSKKEEVYNIVKNHYNKSCYDCTPEHEKKRGIESPFKLPEDLNNDVIDSSPFNEPPLKRTKHVHEPKGEKLLFDK